MRRSLATVVLALVCVLADAGAHPTRASAASSYALAPGSQLQQGCFPPCLCPISLEQPLTGTFRLTQQAPTPLFEVYDVSDVVWHLKRGDTDVVITGSGTYRRGGEFALMQELTLDLSVGGQPPQHFDSGLVVGGGDFPTITVTISINGEVCYDTVIDVVAKPLAGCG